MTLQANWLPPRLLTEKGRVRRVGIELELAGLTPEQILHLLQQRFGGDIRKHTIFEHTLTGTLYGTFKIELDAKSLKEMAHTFVTDEAFDPDSPLDLLGNLSAELLTRTVENFVPWEIVSPPIPITELASFNVIIDDLRTAGGLGTRYAPQYAFGLHLNPELPDLSASTIVNYLRAFFCLYEWIHKYEVIDLTRRITPYIKHFEKDYILKVLAPDYAPDMTQLIDDYLLYNPTRNRSMDLLPLFCTLDEPRVRAAVDDMRVKARPTLHYRLPNCDLDNPNWSLFNTWQLWLRVEQLACSKQLPVLCQDYTRELNRLTHMFNSGWIDYLRQNLLPTLKHD